MKGAFRGVMMEFKHLVDSKHAKESAMQAALEQREFYESIVYEQVYEQVSETKQEPCGVASMVEARRLCLPKLLHQ